MLYKQEPRTMTFRGEEYSYTAHFYECPDTHEHFTTTETDTMDLEQVFSQYREKYGIPNPAEIAHMRRKYKVSARRMSEILGIGTNQYRLYEAGEMPSEAIGKMLKNIMSPEVFLSYVENSKNQFDERVYSALIENCRKTINGGLMTFKLRLDAPIMLKSRKSDRAKKEFRYENICYPNF